MAVWELALLFVGITVFMTNMVNVFLTLSVMRKYGPVFDKSLRILNKLMDNSEKTIDEMFNNEEE